MLTLYLIRHAKTEDRLNHPLDIHRQLTSDGLHDAQLIGNFFSTNHHIVDVLMYSHASRTTQTARAINESLQLPTERLVIKNEIYHADSTELMRIIQATKSSFIRHLALVGHNPTLTDCASALCTENVPPFAPAQVVALTFKEADWQKIQPHSGSLKFVYIPKGKP
ncbi:MAG: SixA phosphatase family protein [Flammeovirgaceae bacterium]